MTLGSHNLSLHATKAIAFKIGQGSKRRSIDGVMGHSRMSGITNKMHMRLFRAPFCSGFIH